jgi:hypothetical protein
LRSDRARCASATGKRAEGARVATGKKVLALPLKVTVPPGVSLEAESDTVAVHTLGLPCATVVGVQDTVVPVGSINASTATHHGPPGSVMKLAWMSLALVPLSSARPIEPVVWSTQYTQEPSLATPVGSWRSGT